jgi:hypothetical protein
MIGDGELDTYWSAVPSIERSCGSPSIVGSKRASLRLTVAVCGTELAITASRAWGVPGTAARMGARA